MGIRGKGKVKLFKGYRITGNRFQASISYRTRIFYLGSYRKEIEAAYAYNFAAQMLGKKKINSIPEGQLLASVQTTIELNVWWSLEREFTKRKWEPLKLPTR